MISMILNSVFNVWSKRAVSPLSALYVCPSLFEFGVNGRVMISFPASLFASFHMYYLELGAPFFEGKGLLVQVIGLVD